MSLKDALIILQIVKCDFLGYARDLSYTPSKKEIGQAIQTVEEYFESLGSISGK